MDRPDLSICTRRSRSRGRVTPRSPSCCAYTQCGFAKPQHKIACLLRSTSLPMKPSTPAFDSPPASRVNSTAAAGTHNCTLTWNSHESCALSTCVVFDPYRIPLNHLPMMRHALPTRMRCCSTNICLPSSSIRGRAANPPMCDIRTNHMHSPLMLRTTTASQLLRRRSK